MAKEIITKEQANKIASFIYLNLDKYINENAKGFSKFLTEKEVKEKKNDKN